MITLPIIHWVGILAVAFTPLLIVGLWGCAKLRATISPAATVPDLVELPDIERLPEGIFVIDPRRVRAVEG
jgi:hypothetical protein